MQGGALLHADAFWCADIEDKTPMSALEPQVLVSAVPGYILSGARFGLDVAVIAEPKGENGMYRVGTHTWGGAFGVYCWVDPANDLFVSGMAQVHYARAQHLGLKTDYPDLKRESAPLLYWCERC